MQDRQNRINQDRNKKILAGEYELDEGERERYNALLRARIHKENMEKIIKKLVEEVANQSKGASVLRSGNRSESTVITKHEIS